MSSVQLADIDDYINPSQACINPLFTSSKTSTKNTRTDGKSRNNSDDNNESNNANNRSSSSNLINKRRRRRIRTPIVISEPQTQLQQKDVIMKTHEDGTHSNITTIEESINMEHDVSMTDIIPTNTVSNNTNDKASITIADCLACSGCITSSEAVLVTTQHSITTLKKNCCFTKNDNDDRNKKRKIVFTISPAAIADLMRVIYKDMDVCGNDHDTNGCKKSQLIQMTYQRLTSFLHEHYNASIVLDGTIPQRISLLQSALEFCTRYRYLYPSFNNDTNYVTTTTSLSQNSTKNVSDLSNNNNNINILTPSIALSATETRFLLNSDNSNQQTRGIELKHDAGIDPRLHFLSSMSSQDLSNPKVSDSIYNSQIHPQRILPMLASSCPGFVCYVEKTTPDVIPNLCTVKSPMAIAGSMFKHNNIIVQSDSVENDKNDKDDGERLIYHVAIMPCHDKKLEAERKDFAWERYVEQEQKFIPDIDLVITTNELFSILTESALCQVPSYNNYNNNDFLGQRNEEKRIDKLKEYFLNLPLAPITGWNDVHISDGVYIPSIKEYENDAMYCNSEITNIDDSTMIGSGSYAEFIFRYASFALFGYQIPSETPLPWKSMTRRGSVASNNFSRSGHSQLRKRTQQLFSDYNEVTLYRHSNGTYSLNSLKAAGDVDEKTVLKFATSYGFKNIQLLLQHMKTNEFDRYHYVETMACPSGCLNGGGQIKSETALNNENDLLLEVVNRTEKPSEKRDRVTRAKKFVLDIGPVMCNNIGGQASDKGRYLLHTRYHVVPKLELTTGSTAGVKVDDTQW